MIIANKQIVDGGVLDPIDQLDHCLVFGKLNMNIKYNKTFIHEIWNYSGGYYTDVTNQLLQIPWGVIINDSDNVDSQAMNQSNFYSANIPGKARLSGTTAKLVFNKISMKQFHNINRPAGVLASMGEKPSRRDAF